MSKGMNWKKLRKKALEIMIQWLSHENELGKAPAAIEVAEEFDYEDGHAYILKYKEEKNSDWWFGVCVLDEEGEDCGLNFSDFELYEPETAKEKSLQMIAYLQEYYQNRAKEYFAQYGVTEEEYASMSEEEWENRKAEVDSERSSVCQNFVLLEKPEFDFDVLVDALKKDWGMEIESYEVEDGNLVLHYEENLFGVSLLDMPIPAEEIEYAAQGNYMWKGAMEAAKKHTAHLLVFAMNQEHNIINAYKCMTKVVCACINQTNALGIYATGTVLEPAFYQKVGFKLKEDILPIPIWVYVGFGKTETGNVGFTHGLHTFGMTDIEVIESKRSPEEIWGFLLTVSDYVLSSGLRFTDGEVLKFAADQEYVVTKAESMYGEGEVYRIGY